MQTSARCSTLKMSKINQYKTNLAETHRDWEHPRRAVQQITQSKGSLSPESKWTCKVLPQQTRDRLNDLVNRNHVSDILDCGHPYTIQGPNGRVLQEKQSTFEAYLLWQLNTPSLYNSKREQKAQKSLLSRPQAKKGENHVIQDRHSRHYG